MKKLSKEQRKLVKETVNYQLSWYFVSVTGWAIFYDGNIFRIPKAKKTGIWKSRESATKALYNWAVENVSNVAHQVAFILNPIVPGYNYTDRSQKITQAVQDITAGYDPAELLDELVAEKRIEIKYVENFKVRML